MVKPGEENRLEAKELLLIFPLQLEKIEVQAAANILPVRQQFLNHIHRRDNVLFNGKKVIIVFPQCPCPQGIPVPCNHSPDVVGVLWLHYLYAVLLFENVKKFIKIESIPNDIRLNIAQELVLPSNMSKLKAIMADPQIGKLLLKRM